MRATTSPRSTCACGWRRHRAARRGRGEPYRRRDRDGVLGRDRAPQRRRRPAGLRPPDRGRLRRRTAEPGRAGPAQGRGRRAYLLTEYFSLVGSTWHDESLTDDAPAQRGRAARRVPAGRHRCLPRRVLSSTITSPTAAIARRRCSKAASHSACSTRSSSSARRAAWRWQDGIDRPARVRHRLGARYAITPGSALSAVVRDRPRRGDRRRHAAGRDRTGARGTEPR